MEVLNLTWNRPVGPRGVQTGTDSAWALGLGLSHGLGDNVAKDVFKRDEALSDHAGRSASDRPLGSVSLRALWLGAARFGRMFPNELVQHGIGIANAH